VLRLLELFENKCANCEAQGDGVDLDHFFFPRSRRGCFIMRQKDGWPVNNAVPLCWRCNRRRQRPTRTSSHRSGWMHVMINAPLVRSHPLGDGGRAGQVGSCRFPPAVEGVQRQSRASG
jgi:hypothetical protein